MNKFFMEATYALWSEMKNLSELSIPKDTDWIIVVKFLREID
ncbi:hypothetical protein [Inconstantimicrobium mannanitabidum]|nr:hypothetical protein [Clostridium sp. TW13]